METEGHVDVELRYDATLRCELHEGTTTLVLTHGFGRGDGFKPNLYRSPILLPVEVLPRLQDAVATLTRADQPEKVGQRPTIGRIVRYVRHDGLVERPAIIVRVWPGSITNNVQLQVFNDSGEGRRQSPHNDDLPNVTWETSVVYDEEKKPHTWHWPDQV